jgi:pantothenate kinase
MVVLMKMKVTLLVLQTLLYVASSFHFDTRPLSQNPLKSYRGHGKLSLRQAATDKKVDHKMMETYEHLAQHCVDMLPMLTNDHQWFCAITGGPGSGKSTLCENVVALINEKVKEERAVVIPMDGYHYSKKQLCKLDPPDAATLLPRRGAPETFDAEGFYNALVEARKLHTKQFPTYSRQLSDPVAEGVTLKPSHKLVFVEGNYLLLGNLQDDHETDAKTKKEASRWYPLLNLFDEKWFISPLEGVEEQRGRLIKRHLETWSDAKTKMWKAKTAEEGAAKRTDFNDVPNAHLVERTKPYADFGIVSR